MSVMHENFYKVVFQADLKKFVFKNHTYAEYYEFLLFEKYEHDTETRSIVWK